MGIKKERNIKLFPEFLANVLQNQIQATFFTFVLDSVLTESHKLVKNKMSVS